MSGAGARGLRPAVPSPARRRAKGALKRGTATGVAPAGSSRGSRGKRYEDGDALEGLARGCPRAFLRKEVIQPQVPLRLPCYDFTPVADPTVIGCLLAVGTPASGRTNSHGVTGGVYKARERIHRGMLVRDY